MPKLLNWKRSLGSLLLLPILAQAQAWTPPKPLELPSLNGTGYNYLEFAASPDGACVRWVYKNPDSPIGFSRVTYCGLRSELSKVGSRIETIFKASDPLLSIQTMHKRFPVEDLSLPKFDLVRNLFPNG